MPTIDPALLQGAGEWQIGGVEAPDAAPAQDDFGGVLGRQLESLAELQSDASSASAELAAGTASDPASVVMAVERAQLSMQLASQLRTKGVEAMNEIFRTQV